MMSNARNEDNHVVYNHIVFKFYEPSLYEPVFYKPAGGTTSPAFGRWIACEKTKSRKVTSIYDLTKTTVRAKKVTIKIHEEHKHNYIHLPGASKKYFVANVVSLLRGINTQILHIWVVIGSIAVNSLDLFITNESLNAMIQLFSESSNAANLDVTLIHKHHMRKITLFPHFLGVLPSSVKSVKLFGFNIDEHAFDRFGQLLKRHELLHFSINDEPHDIDLNRIGWVLKSLSHSKALRSLSLKHFGIESTEMDLFEPIFCNGVFEKLCINVCSAKKETWLKLGNVMSKSSTLCMLKIDHHVVRWMELSDMKILFPGNIKHLNIRDLFLAIDDDVFVEFFLGSSIETLHATSSIYKKLQTPEILGRLSSNVHICKITVSCFIPSPSAVAVMKPTLDRNNRNNKLKRSSLFETLLCQLYQDL